MHIVETKLSLDEQSIAQNYQINKSPPRRRARRSPALSADIYGILGHTTFCHKPLPPSDAFNYIAQRLIGTQAVRDSKDRCATQGSDPCS